MTSNLIDTREDDVEIIINEGKIWVNTKQGCVFRGYACNSITIEVGSELMYKYERLINKNK